MANCKVEGCETPVLAKGLCQRHYARLRRTGEALGSSLPSAEDRFWAKVDKTGDCWLWTGYTNKDGKPFFHMDGRPISAHKAAWEISKGPLPDGVVVEHICRTPNCVRLEHLRLSNRRLVGENRRGASKNNRTSGIRGVTWDKERNLWQASVGHMRKVHFVGRFASLDEAEAAVIKARLELHTHNELDRAG